MFPLLLFATAIVSIFIYLRTDSDIFSLLAIGISISCLIWGLVIAHWFVHLLALLAVFWLGRPVAVATVNPRQR